MADEDGRNVCTYILKGLVVIFGAGGIVMSWLAASTCEFISFVDSDGNPPDRAEDPPFNQALAANVGIFNYQITEYTNRLGAGLCESYDDRFAQLSGYPSVATAQFCALIAPIFAGLAIFANLFDCLTCNFAGSYLISSLLFMIAAGIQAGCFTMIADPAFCFEDAELECSQEKGVYFNAGAMVLYFLASCFICCAPRAEPLCFALGGDSPREQKRNESKQTVVVQPIVVQPADSER